MASIYDWSVTASSNASADAAINFAEGMNPAAVNDSARALMGRVAELVSDISGACTIGGSATVMTIEGYSGFTTYANGRVIVARAGTTNGASATLNVNSIGSKPIRVFTSSGETAAPAGAIQSGGVYVFSYSTAANSGSGGWVLSNPATAIGASDLLTLMLTVDGSGSGLDADLLDGQEGAYYQQGSDSLDAIRALTAAADKFPYFTASDTAALADLSAFAKTILDDADAAAVRTTIGAQATIAAIDVGTWEAGTGTTESTITPAKAAAVVASIGQVAAILEDQKTSGTDGGTATAGSWFTRTINTEVYDPHSIVTLGSSQFTASVDCYCEFSAPGRRVGLNQARLYNVTDGVAVAYGSTESADTGGNTHSVSRGFAPMTAGKTYRLEQRVTTTQATNGLGLAAGFGNAEVYSRVVLYRR